jgi:hypothetical protein
MTATANLRSSAEPGAEASAQHDKLADLYTALVDEVHKLLTGDGWRAWLQTAARFHQYSFLNTLLIHAQRPDATHVAGYRVWQSLGRQVDKGQRGIRILAPIVRRTELGQEQVETMPSDVPARSGPARKVVGFRATNVWDVAQTSGIPLAAPPQSVTAVAWTTFRLPSTTGCAARGPASGRRRRRSSMTWPRLGGWRSASSEHLHVGKP